MSRPSSGYCSTSLPLPMTISSRPRLSWSTVARSSATRIGSSSESTVTPVESRMRDVRAAIAPRITVGAEDSTSPACRSPTANESNPSSSASTAVSMTRFSRSDGATASPVTGWGGLKTMSSTWKRTVLLLACVRGEGKTEIGSSRRDRQVHVPISAGTADLVRNCRSGRGGLGGGVALRDLLADDRDDVPAEVDRVVEQVVAARGDDADAEVVVREQRLRDLLRRADERVGVAGASGGLGGGGPQGGVVPLALGRDLQEALRARVLGLVDRVPAAELPARGGLARLDAVEDAVRLLPRELLGRRDDRAERGVDARRRRPARGGGLGVHALDLLRGAVQRLAPDGVAVRLGGAHAERGVRRPAERDGRRPPLERLGVEREVGEVVEPAVVVERRVARPPRLDDLDVLVSAGVPLVLGEGVALATLLAVVPAGDEMDGQAAAGELVERRERLGGVRRVGHVGPVREQQLDRLQTRGGVRGERRRLGAGRAVREQDARPAGVL